MTTTTQLPASQMTRKACVAYLQAHGVYAGHSRDGIDLLREAVNDHRYGAELDPPTPEPEALPAGPDRVAAAKAEHKLLQAWIKDGENPPRPATPNLDALNADHAAGATATHRARPDRQPKGPRRSERGQQAMAVKAEKGKRGPGKRLTADELAAYVAAVRTAHPTATATDELEFAYWVEGIALSRKGWMAAWAATEVAAAA